MQPIALKLFPFLAWRNRVNRVTLRADLLAFLEAHAGTVGAELRDFVMAAPPRNASAHGDWRDYYDTDLAALVAERDAMIVDRFGYRFRRNP